MKKWAIPFLLLSALVLGGWLHGSGGGGASNFLIDVPNVFLLDGSGGKLFAR